MWVDYHPLALIARHNIFLAGHYNWCLSQVTALLMKHFQDSIWSFRTSRQSFQTSQDCRCGIGLVVGESPCLGNATPITPGPPGPDRLWCLVAGFAETLWWHSHRKRGNRICSEYLSWLGWKECFVKHKVMSFFSSAQNPAEPLSCELILLNSLSLSGSITPSVILLRLRLP